MARKQKQETLVKLPPAEAVIQPITETIEKNYMPYVMSVIISRAIPEIDGFKPSQRKLLYTMYKEGLLSGHHTKSTNIVGATMKLHPHGDASIYETMVRLTRGHEALLHPFVDSKGTFGKHYSDMAPAAARYTEVCLDSFSAELFRGIEKDAVDFVPNYDNTIQEPVLLPTSFPNILVNSNMGIAVGMASKICSFNLGEICDGTIQLLKNPNTGAEQMLDIVKGPDFSVGGYLIYNKDQMREIYETGRGSFKLRAKYRYDKSENCIEVLEIPYTTTIEIIIKRISDMIKEGKVKEITDYRDEIDISGFKFTIDLRRGTDPDKFMQRLFKQTTLEDDFSCNFNVIIDDKPLQLGLVDMLKEWIKFRLGCVKRELGYDLKVKEDKLHLLQGLAKILLDIDLAIKIIRGTKNEADVIPNLMKGFDIDKIQADYVADIKLRNLNKEHILNRLKEIQKLQEEIAELRSILASETKQKNLIAKQLKEIKEKYAKPRKTEIIYDDVIEEYVPEDEVEDYNVKFIFTKEGYFKKITLLSLRGNDEQKLKENDYIISEFDGSNRDDLWFFSDKCRIYKAKASQFPDTKASSLGDYAPSKLDFESDEKAVAMIHFKEHKSGQNIVYVFENGKSVKVDVENYETKSNRKRLTGAFSSASPLINAFLEDGDTRIMISSNTSHVIAINTELIPLKSTKTSNGVNVFMLKKNQLVEKASLLKADAPEYKKYRKLKIPAKPSLLEEADIAARQISLE
ncbi:MAG: topoisomerase IV [Ruminococcaceae bacterium]|nr:topoisomerase IV [Oscillospiraceae bacterium]